MQDYSHVTWNSLTVHLLHFTKTMCTKVFVQGKELGLHRAYGASTFITENFLNFLLGFSCYSVNKGPSWTALGASYASTTVRHRKCYRG